MSDSFEFTLHSPLTKEDWNKIADVEHEKTMSVTFQTPQGRQVRYIQCEVLEKIRSEIEHLTIIEGGEDYTRKMAELYSLKIKVLQIIDKYRAESEEKE